MHPVWQESTQPLLPHALMRSYLAYARRHVFPVLSPAAGALPHPLQPTDTAPQPQT